MSQHTDSEIEQAAQRFEQLAKHARPATARVEDTDEVEGLIGPTAQSLPSLPAEL